MTSLEEVHARFARDQGLPFADALTERSILDALDEHGIPYRDRLFSPATTIWVAGFARALAIRGRGRQVSVGSAASGSCLPACP
jgi:hypothetical protein